MRRRFGLNPIGPAVVLLLFAPRCGDRIPSSSAVIPAAHEGWQRDRHQTLNRIVKTFGRCDIAFIGDSITQGWETDGRAIWREHYGKRRAINLGVGGDRTEHVLWRLDNGNLDGLAPKVTVVLIGTNNFGHSTAETHQVLAGIKAVVRKVREKSPTTTILLLGIFPRGPSFNRTRGRILQVNQALAHLHNGRDIHVLDIGHVFVDENGSIDKAVMHDHLHLTAEGYRRWAEAIEPVLATLLTL